MEAKKIIYLPFTSTRVESEGENRKKIAEVSSEKVENERKK